MKKRTTTIKIPALGYSLTEFTIIELPKIGDRIKKGEKLLTLESDKSVHDLDSPYEGVISELLAEKGQVLGVGAELIVIKDIVVAKDTHEDTFQDSEVEASSKEIPVISQWNLVDATESNLESMWDIWFEHQALASRESSLVKDANLFDQFKAMIDRGANSPFCVRCAIENQNLDGWGACLPVKNNPVSRDKIAEVSLYVKDPNAKNNPAVLIMKDLIHRASKTEISFLIGMSSPFNHPVRKLLSNTGFSLLGNAGKQKTQIWIYTF